MSFPIKLGKKKRRNNIKKTENIEKALHQPQELMQLILVSLIKRRKTKVVWIRHHVTLVRSNIITVRNWVTMPTNIQNQKTSFGLGNLLVGD